MKQMIRNYVYQTTNLKNGKIYIGVHRGEINDNYIGSGPRLLRSVKKYGKENFKKLVLKVFLTIEEAYTAEAEIVNAEFLKRKDVYNDQLGGFGGYIHSDETKRKISEARKGKPAWNKGKKRKPYSAEHKRKISEGHKGKKLSESRRKNISAAMKLYWANRKLSVPSV